MSTPEDKPAAPGSADLDEILDETDGDMAPSPINSDPFDEIVREQQYA